MRKLLLATAAGAALLSGSAFAADLPVRSSAPAFAAPAPLAFSWSGFYVGANAGYAWNSSRWTSTSVPAAFTPFNNDGQGFIGGVHAGYNWQMNQIVFGLEGTIDWLDQRASGQCSNAVGFVCRTSQSWLADIGGRLGFAADRALIYATGGVAFTEYKFSNPIPAPATSWGAGSRTGWFLGAGIDFAVTNDWIAGVEYKHYDFGSASSQSNPVGTPVRFRQTEDVIKARLSYKFGGPAGAVVAKY